MALLSVADSSCTISRRIKNPLWNTCLEGELYFQEAGRADGSEAQEAREKGTSEKRQEGRERRKEEKRKEEEGRTFSSLLNVPQAQPRRRQALHADLHSADMLIVCFVTYSIHSDEALVYRRASYTPPRHPRGLLLLLRPL